MSKLMFERDIKTDDLVSFAQQFAGMYEAGIPISRCIEALYLQAENIKFKKVLKTIMLDIEGGSSFSDALARHPVIFSSYFVNMVRAGEKGGIMGKIMDNLALYLEKIQDLKRKVRGAFAYPVLVTILAFLVMSFLVIFIIPVFQDVYAGMNIILPLPTRIMIGLSSIMRQFGLQITIALAAAGFLFLRFRNVGSVRRRIDRVKISLPIFGSIIKKAAVTRFIRTFGEMLDSGVSVPEAISTAKDVSGNYIVAEVVKKMHNNINRGVTLAEALKEQDVIPATVVQMISAGEASATLPGMLKKSSDALERDMDITIKRMLVIVEPALTMGVALVVAFIALSIYLPMFDIIGQIQQR
ncbi:MAG TPA: type II secretion system F family protein [Nitrospirae bacterium]|nr:type II secretion system F family protein [Nitrospirota bacterium]